MKTNDSTKYMTTEEKLDVRRAAAYREYMRTHDEFDMNDYYKERISGKLSKINTLADSPDNNRD